MPASQAGQFIWRREGYGLTYDDVVSWGNGMCLTGASGEKGDTGAAAYALALTADSYVISVSSRGVLKTNQIVLTAIVSNIPIASVVWDCSDGIIEQIELSEGVYDQYRRILDCSAVEGYSAVITLSAAYDGQTYAASLGITKVSEGEPVPYYQGVFVQVPETTTDNEPFVFGDTFLYSGEDTPGFLFGHLYRHIGLDADGFSVWDETTASSDIMAAAYDATTLAAGTNRTVYVAELYADTLVSHRLITAPSSDFSFSVLPDGYVAGDGNAYPVVQIIADNTVLFGVNGYDKTLTIHANGTWRGKVDIENQDGTVVLQTQQKIVGDTITSTPSKTLWSTTELYDEVSLSAIQTLQAIAGSFEGKTIDKGTKTVQGGKVIYYDFPRTTWWASPSVTAYTKVFEYVIPANMNRIEWNIFIGASAQVSLKLINRAHTSTSILLSASEGSFSSGGHYIGSYDVSMYETVQLWIISNGSWWTADDQVTMEAFFGMHAYLHQGVYVHNTDDTVALIPTGGYRSDAISVGSWLHSGNLNYYKGDDLINSFSSLLEGQDILCDDSVSTIAINGSAVPANMLVMTSNQILFKYGSSIYSVIRWGGNGTSAGVYSLLSAHIVLLSKTAGVEVASVTPTTSIATIGTPTQPFAGGYFTKITGGMGLPDWNSVLVVTGSITCPSDGWAMINGTDPYMVDAYLTVNNGIHLIGYYSDQNAYTKGSMAIVPVAKGDVVLFHGFENVSYSGYFIPVR